MAKITHLPTPNHIEVLLHCHVSPRKHPGFNAPAVREALEELRDSGLIHPEEANPLSGIYHTTAKGDAHVRQLCNLALPKQAWVGADGKLIDKPIC